MFKILALDLDGTLLNPEHKISEKNKKIIHELNEEGARIILASGREPNSILPFNHELGIKDFVIGFNGGIISDWTGENIIYEKKLDSKIAENIIKNCQEGDICTFVFIKNKIYVDSKKKEGYNIFDSYTASGLNKVDNIYKFIDDNNYWDRIGKLLLCDDNKVLASFKDKMEKIFGSKLSFGFSLPYFLEIWNPEVSKGKAIQVISEKLNIDRKDIMAIGDGENDISMMKFAGLGVAMGNALESVKKEADYITLSNREDGVEYVIKKYWRGE